MTFAIAFPSAASEAILWPPTPAGEAVEAGHPHIGEADTHQEHHDHHGQSLVTEYWFSVRVLSPTAWRRYCSFAKIISGSLRALTEPLTDHLETKIFLVSRYFMKFFPIPGHEERSREISTQYCDVNLSTN